MPTKPILRYQAGGGTPRSVTASPVLHTLPTGVPDVGTPILNYLPGGGAPAPPTWPPPTNLVYPECGVIQLVNGQSWIDVTFTQTKPDVNWIFEDLQVVNTTDPTYQNIWPGLVTVKSVTGFRVQLNGLPNTDNYFLHWAVGGCATSDWVVSSGGGGAGTSNFLALTDTPDVYFGQSGQGVRVNAGENALEFGDVATTFLALTDAPDDYTGQGGKGVKVNAGEDGLEFGVVSSGGGDVINVLDYGAVADCVTLFDITMPNGNVVTSASHTFVEADVGKWAIVRGATAGGISPLIATITAVSGHTATLSVATTTALTNVQPDSFPRMDFGTDNTVPFDYACLAVPGPGQRWNFGAGVPFAGAGVMNPILPGDGGDGLHSAWQLPDDPMLSQYTWDKFLVVRSEQHHHQRRRYGCDRDL